MLFVKGLKSRNKCCWITNQTEQCIYVKRNFLSRTSRFGKYEMLFTSRLHNNIFWVIETNEKRQKIYLKSKSPWQNRCCRVSVPKRNASGLHYQAVAEDVISGRAWYLSKTRINAIAHWDSQAGSRITGAWRALKEAPVWRQTGRRKMDQCGRLESTNQTLRTQIYGTWEIEISHAECQLRPPTFHFIIVIDIGKGFNQTSCYASPIIKWEMTKC